MSTQIFNKLVRDKIPQIIEQDGRKAIYEVLSDSEYIEHLNLKLQEELKEYLNSYEIDELADMYEVLLAILAFRGVSEDELQKIRIDKYNERGGFIDRIFLKEVCTAF